MNLVFEQLLIGIETCITNFTLLHGDNIAQLKSWWALNTNTPNEASTYYLATHLALILFLPITLVQLSILGHILLFMEIAIIKSLTVTDLHFKI